MVLTRMGGVLGDLRYRFEHVSFKYVMSATIAIRSEDLKSNMLTKPKYFSNRLTDYTWILL